MGRRPAKNPWVGLNFIPDNERMEVPPAYFLQRIHDFDPDIVILPSRMVPFAYVIARRRKFTAGLTDKALEATIDQRDTKMCMLHNLVPVCLMYKTGPSWDPDQITRKLAARDMWTLAEGKTSEERANWMADRLDEEDEREREKTRADIRDDLWNRSGDAYRSYKYRTGQRVSTAQRTERLADQTAPSTSGSTDGTQSAPAR
jgi:hypothetical protein